MHKYDLADKEDLQLRFSIMLPGRSLYEYLCELPLEKLEVYPKKGYHWWMGKTARSPQAIELRNYIFHWRLEAMRFREKYPREYLQTLSRDALQLFLQTYLQKVPLWAYEKPLQDAIHLLFHIDKVFEDGIK